MKPRTEELLYHLLWHVDLLMRPTFRNLTGSFEGWAYRKGFLRQLQQLESRRLLERQPGSSAAEAIYRLSDRGRLIALGGRDPIAQWNRDWDGRWRMVLFDLPEDQATARVKLRRYLRSHGFGYLQKSVWISPDPLSNISQELSTCVADVESVLTLEARPASGETDAGIVKGAWDFAAINRRYEACLQVFADRPQTPVKEGLAADALQRWAQHEKRVWLEAVSADPLLPDRLLPDGYLGKRAWHHRVGALADAARLIR